MASLAAHSESDALFAICFLSALAFVLLLIAFAKLREFFFPRQIDHRLRRFFGRHDYARLEAHEKSFPGYDLPSVHRALSAFFSEKCTSTLTVGACPHISTFQDLLNSDANSYLRRSKPSAPSYTRLPVDVDQDDSFVSHCIYFATLPPPPAGPAPKLAVMLTHQKIDRPHDDGLESSSAPASLLKISIACTDRALAARFFTELESSRKHLSIYRGKVIDPNVTPAGIQSISFRRIQRVGPEDLVLPDAVRSLVDGSIVAFYRNRDALSSLGVELKRGVLFNSPPGTGKTSISLFLASFLPDFTVCFISGRKLLFPREVCEMARYLQPTMLVFEDIDLIAQDRDVNGLATVLGELMNQIDGCEPNDQVLFIMNTNSMDRIEQAVRNRPGRVDQIIDIPLPDIDARRSLIKYFARNLTLWPEDIDRLAAATDGVTPAELKEVVKRAAVLAVSRTHSHPAPTNGTPLQLTGSDLLLAFHQTRALRS